MTPRRFIPHPCRTWAATVSRGRRELVLEGMQKFLLRKRKVG
jgi:hypothetical protein